MARYRRRQPETTVLYRVVHGHLDALIAQADARYEFGYPAHIEKTYRAYLACGLLRHGFARVVCEACGNEMLVAFSCYLQPETMRSSGLEAGYSCRYAMIPLLIVFGLQAKR